MAEAGRRPILVTGSHRSGSTWFGRMIAVSPEVTYIQEPFNMQHRPGICRARFPGWFTCLDDTNGQPYIEPLRECLALDYHIGAELAVARSPRDFLRLGRDLGRFMLGRMHHTRSLMKDPVALFSAEWLARTFDMEVIVLVRHPAAFVGSLKKAQWKFPFDDLLRQPLLMDKYLPHYRTRLEECARGQHDLIDQGILLWNMFLDVIGTYQDRHPAWLFLRHEDVSKDPVRSFERIYGRLGLAWGGRVAERISAYSSMRNAPGDYSVSDIRRDSRAEVQSWTKRLTPEEIGRVRSGTEAIAARYYGASDW